MKYFKFVFLIIFLIFSTTEIFSIDLLTNINTDNNEFSPSISPDGTFMLFNSKRDGDLYQDIYVSYFRNDIWSKPEKFDLLNSPYDDETPFISQDGKIILFSSNRDGSIERRLDDNKTLVSYDIYISRLINGKWSSPEPISGNINTSDHERAPSINNRNDRIFFSRWTMGKIENAAIYFSVLSNGIFSEVYALPSEVNSGNKEVALIPDPNGKGYYFSSTREGGKGGWDIYFISFRDGQFGMPINLGDTINSPGNEAFFSIFNGKIYYCSDFGPNSKNYNIVGKHLPGEKILYFRIVDKEDNALSADADIQKIFSDKKHKNFMAHTNSEGKFSTIIDDKTDGLNIFIEKPGYLPYYRKINDYELVTPEFKIVLEPLNPDDSFSIEAIYFDYNKYNIKSESFVFLDRLSDFLQKNPEIKIKIIGHTDLHGTEEFNQILSEERAKSVQSYLLKKGISLERLQSAGMGKSHPIINEIGEHADRLNRRTEFKIFK